MKAATIDEPTMRVRTLPVATGASTTRPHDRYHGWTTGPRATMMSMVRPMARRAPIRSDFNNSHTPAAHATTTPRTRVIDSTVCSVHPDPHQMGQVGPRIPAPVAGATHERTVPGVERFNTQLHPRPVTTDSAPITAVAISPAVTTGRIRARTGSPVPIQSQPM